MEQYFLAFVTGLTTGGLSCLAVQGGLLASSLVHQVEKDVVDAKQAKRRKGARSNTALPIALFLFSKLIAYTILGLLLGLLGQILTLNTTLRAVLLIGIGIFMIGNALRMFNVHPIFRYFSIEPPKFITRYIRRTAKQGTDWFSPLFLGGLTVLIPCGVTQAMMAVALTTGNPLQGAALMFAFVLGTSPVFFLVAYLTMQLGARLEKWFMRFVAVMILILGLISINNGLSLSGSPLAVSNLTRSFQQVRTSNDTQGSVANPNLQASSTKLSLTAENYGYVPQVLYAKAGEKITLDIVTDNVQSCARAFVIPSLGYEALLPEKGTVTVEIPAQSAGTVMPFSCSMGMYTGEIIFGE